VPRNIDKFAPQRRFQSSGLDRDGKAREQHLSDCHLVDDRVEPIDKQKLKVRRLARHLYGGERLHLGMGDDCSQRDRGLLKRLRGRRTEATYPDIRVMGKMLPSGAAITEELVTFAICIFRGVLCASRPLFQRGHQRVIFDDLPTWRFEYAWRAAP
jgi:hypothetical protein